MAKYEYQAIQSAKGGRISHLNERLDVMIEEGWDPISMCGDETVTVLMRRATQQAAPQQKQAPAAGAQAQPLRRGGVTVAEDDGCLGVELAVHDAAEAFPVLAVRVEAAAVRRREPRRQPDNRRHVVDTGGRDPAPRETIGHAVRHVDGDAGQVVGVEETVILD